MKKNLSKLFAMALALIMVMALTVPAMAAQAPTTGSITITNATAEENYAGYKIFDLTYTEVEGDDGETDILQSYRISTDNQFYTEVSAKTDLFELTATSDSKVYTVEPVGEDADIIEWLQGLNLEGKKADLTAKTAENATVAWDNVPFGYYLITSSLGATVTVDQNTPDVTIIDKNQEPTWGDGGKKIGEDTLEIGEEGEFTVTFTGTNYDGEDMITEYIVSDDMPDGMTLVRKVADEKDTTFTVTVNDVAADFEVEYGVDDPDDFTITIPWTTGEGAAEAPAYTSPATVVVKYTVKLNSDAAISGEGNTNSASVKWNDKGGEEGGFEIPSTDTVYTYALSIKKVNLEGEGLAGATFELKNGDEVVTVSESTGTDNAIAGANYYVVDPEGTATITSPTNGLIIIKGVDDDTYTLTEKTAPLGYNLLQNPVSVTAQPTSATTTDTTIYLDENGDVVAEEEAAAVTVNFDVDYGSTAVAVLNKTGTELPSTGGMGTTLFYTIGGVLVVAAGVLLVTKKRMNNMEG